LIPKLETAKIVLPSMAGLEIAAAMPAHSGLFRTAAARDRANVLGEKDLIQWLNQTDWALRSGRMDNISALTQLTDRVNAT
jgi:hypothetical protein